MFTRFALYPKCFEKIAQFIPNKVSYVITYQFSVTLYPPLLITDHIRLHTILLSVEEEGELQGACC